MGRGAEDVIGGSNGRRLSPKDVCRGRSGASGVPFMHRERVVPVCNIARGTDLAEVPRVIWDRTSRETRWGSDGFRLAATTKA